MDTFHVGLMRVQTSLVEVPVHYFYCHECYRWYTAFSAREWPFYCPHHHVRSRKHLSLARLKARFTQLSTTPVTQTGFRDWLLSVFNTDSIRSIDQFLLRHPPDLDKQPAAEVVRAFLTQGRRRIQCPPRTTTWQYRLVYELGDVLARDEFERMNVDPTGDVPCPGCRRLWHRAIQCPECHSTTLLSALKG